MTEYRVRFIDINSRVEEDYFECDYVEIPQESGMIHFMLDDGWCVASYPVERVLLVERR